MGARGCAAVELGPVEAISLRHRRPAAGAGINARRAVSRQGQRRRNGDGAVAAQVLHQQSHRDAQRRPPRNAVSRIGGICDLRRHLAPQYLDPWGRERNVRRRRPVSAPDLCLCPDTQSRRRYSRFRHRSPRVFRSGLDRQPSGSACLARPEGLEHALPTIPVEGVPELVEVLRAA